MLKILKHLNLSQKLSLLLSLIFVGGLAISASSVNALLNAKAQNQISLQAQILLEATSAVRDYTDTQVRPYLENNTQNLFLPQTIPAYSAREVFEKFRANESWGDYLYKEATLNPTNPRDKADLFETYIINRFRRKTNTKQLTGFRSQPFGKLFYIAQPFAITQSSCLECHSTPEAAPKSMIDRYGRDNGFGWKLNEILGARIIYVPASKVMQTAHQSFVKVMTIIFAIFTVAILAVNWWLNRYIVRPLNRMTQTAEALSKGNMEAEFEQNSHDEVGRLAKAFTLMKISLRISINKLEEFRTKLNSLNS